MDGVDLDEGADAMTGHKKRRKVDVKRPFLRPSFPLVLKEVRYLYYQSDIFIKLFKIIYGFVMCNKIYQYTEGTITGICVQYC